MTTRQALRRSIEGFSGTLGPLPGQVASSLTQLNVRGVPKTQANAHFRVVCGRSWGAERSVVNVAVTDRSIHVKRSPGHLPIIVRLPRAVRTFILAFDSGCYPELVGSQDSQVPRRNRYRAPLLAFEARRASRRWSRRPLSSHFWRGSWYNAMPVVRLRGGLRPRPAKGEDGSVPGL